MNSIIRNLVIAAPLATAALTLAPAAAMATEPGPVIVIAPVEPKPDLDLVAPAPQPEPQPELDLKAADPAEPKGPQDKAPAPKPVEPQGPGDITNPEPEPTQPEGPGDITNPQPCPTHGVDCTPDKDEDEPTGGNGGSETSDDVDATDSFAVPTRIDAGLAAEEQNGLELSWLLAGGALVTASGAAFAARNRMRRRA